MKTRPPLEPQRILRGMSYLLSLSLAVFVRKQFGDRLVGDLLAANAFSWLCFWFYSLVQPELFPTAPSRLASVYICALSALSTCQILLICFRRKNRADIHSYSVGRSFGWRPELPSRELTVERYVQPLLCLWAGLDVLDVDPALAVWIAAGSVALFIEGQVSRFQMRSRALDAIDGRIEAKMLNDSIQERASEAATAPSSTVLVAPGGSRPSKSVGSIIDRLDPELRRLLGEQPKPNANENIG